MPIEPQIPTRPTPQTHKTCIRCHQIKPISEYAQTHSVFFDGYSPICNLCLDDYLRGRNYEWDAVDALCRWLDIPFIVKEWDRLRNINGDAQTWPIYARVFVADAYQAIGWADYYKQYVKLRENGLLDDEIPLVNQKHLEELRQKWGSNYSDEDLFYLEDLYKGLLQTQNVNGALQTDQAQKLCKLSLIIDERIRNGDKEVDKFLASYDKLVKVTGFTPKNVKNAVDFDSFAEVAYWLEKRGNINKFYDGTTRDVIDETLKNINDYARRLYVNEGGIGDEITERLHTLKMLDKKDEGLYNLSSEVDDGTYEIQGYALEEDDSEFEVNEDEQYD